MVRKSTPTNFKIPVREATKKKFDRAAKDTKRKLVDVADIAVDLYLKSASEQPEHELTGAR